MKIKRFLTVVATLCIMQLFTSAPKALAEEQELDGGIASVECVNSNQQRAMVTWFIKPTNGGVLVGDNINFTFQRLSR